MEFHGRRKEISNYKAKSYLQISVLIRIFIFFFLYLSSRFKHLSWNRVMKKLQYLKNYLNLFKIIMLIYDALERL